MWLTSSSSESSPKRAKVGPTDEESDSEEEVALADIDDESFLPSNEEEKKAFTVSLKASSCPPNAAVTNSQLQTVMLSATLSSKVQNLAGKIYMYSYMGELTVWIVFPTIAICTHVCIHTWGLS